MFFFASSSWNPGNPCHAGPYPYISMPSGDAREQFEPGNMLHHRAGLHLRGSIRPTWRRPTSGPLDGARCPRGIGSMSPWASWMDIVDGIEVDIAVDIVVDVEVVSKICDILRIRMIMDSFRNGRNIVKHQVVQWWFLFMRAKIQVFGFWAPKWFAYGHRKSSWHSLVHHLTWWLQLQWNTGTHKGRATCQPWEYGSMAGCVALSLHLMSMGWAWA